MAARNGLVAFLILGGVALILFLNQEPAPPAPSGAPTAGKPQATKSADEPKKTQAASAPGRPQEHPIGDEVEKNHIRVAAVWLASVGMDGMPVAEGTKVVHVEADIKATEQNPNGFAKDEFVPYLKVGYKITPKGASQPIQAGEMLPMVAFDGLHYGANIPLPAPGTYDLEYAIQPPSAGGLGRHSDPVTGVAPWWEPFKATFEWVVEAK